LITAYVPLLAKCLGNILGRLFQIVSGDHSILPQIQVSGDLSGIAQIARLQVLFLTPCLAPFLRVKLQGKAAEIAASISSNQGKVDDRTLMRLTEQVGGTHDLMVFNATKGAVHIRRTQGTSTLPWQTFRLD